MKNAKRIISLTLALILALAVFASCGKKNTSASTDTDSTKSADTASSGQTDTVPETSASAKTADGEINPYAWLGLEDMPKCNYLDIVSSNHYVQTCDYYALSLVTEQTEAVDGINTYSNNGTTRQYSIDGVTYSINDSARMYLEYDLSSTVGMAKANIENAMATGTNIKSRVFSTTGKAPIPLYSDNGDTAEYDYYEYVNDNSTETLTNKVTERFFMKDGDVFAIYTLAEISTTSTESLKVIKSISAEIPEGMISVPDLTGYEKYN